MLLPLTRHIAIKTAHLPLCLLITRGLSAPPAARAETAAFSHPASPLPLAPETMAALLITAGLGFLLVRYRHKLTKLRNRERFYRTLAEGLQHWELWTGPDGGLLFSTAACEDISGYSAEAFKKDPDLFYKIIHPEDADSYRQALCSKDENRLEFRVIGRNGETRWVECHCRPEKSTDGRRASIRDITPRKEQERHCRLAQFAIDSSGRPIGMTDMQGTITYANQAMRDLFEYGMGQDMAGMPLAALLEHPEEGAQIVRALHDSGCWQGELPARTLQGKMLDLEIQAFVTRDTADTPLSLIAYFSDITSKKAMEREIRRIAFCDALTGLPNRIALKQELERALNQASRNAGALAVLMLDLDDFKQINDTVGHAKGDELLLQMSRRLRRLLGTGDTLARLGGDEFVLVLGGIREACDAAKRTEQILATLSEKPFDLGEGQFFTSGSIGIALYPQAGNDPETLVKHADMAMYEAKHGGRNSFRFFSEEIHRRTLERHQLEAGLRRAMHNLEFFLVYQPQIDLATGRIIAVEALVRWQHPEKGVLSPGTFISVVEETGIIHILGKWILKTACHQARQWQNAGLAPIRIAVNLSAQQFRQPGLLECIEEILDETKLDANLLELEITESVFMENIESAIEVLVDLKTRSIRIAIDDFGTGYSSLSYLKNFPIDRIKIAQDFVRDIPADRDDAAIVETIMVMANRLGLEVIAEGVETREQMDFLKLRGCSEMQGYYFARPMRAEAVQEFIENHNSRLCGAEAAMPALR